MKVVINVQFGGFGVSHAALKRLIARSAACVEQWPDTEDAAVTETLRTIMRTREDAGDGYERVSGLLGMGTLYKNGTVYSCSSSSQYRTDPDLIAVVEELGEAANGQYATLRVVEIPDGIAFTIEEYDGNEHIAEAHRTWA